MKTVNRGKITVTTEDGWTLHADVLAPPAPVGAAVIGHAMMIDRRRLDWPQNDGLATTLAHTGILVINADLRGHGESHPPATRTTDWSYDDLVFKDTPALIAVAREQAPELPLALVGHSLFGHVAAGYLGLTPDAPVDALVGLGANVWLEQFEPNRLRWLRKRLVMELVSVICTVFGYFPTRLLRQGTDNEARTYFQQMIDWARTGRWTSQSGCDYLAGIESVDVPMLNVVGGRDKLLCVPESAERMWRHWGGYFEQWVVDRSWDLDYVPSHIGIAMNPASRPVWERIARWLSETFASEEARAGST